MEKKVLEFLDELLPKRMMDGSIESIVDELEMLNVDNFYVGCETFALWFRDHKGEIEEAAGKERMERLLSSVNMIETDMMRYVYALKVGMLKDAKAGAHMVYTLGCDMNDIVYELMDIHALQVPPIEELRRDYCHLVPVLG